MIENLRSKETKGTEEAYGGADNTEPASASGFSRDGGLLNWLTEFFVSLHFVCYTFDARDEDMIFLESAVLCGSRWGEYARQRKRRLKNRQNYLPCEGGS